MPYSAKAVTNYFLGLAERSGTDLNSMKAQRLVYFAHGWRLGLTDKPLLKEAVEAWSIGPVVRVLYYTLRPYGTGPIKDKLTAIRSNERGTPELFVPTIGSKYDPDHSVRRIVDRVWEVFGKYDGIRLSNMTHEPETPWFTIYERHGGDLRNRPVIPNDLIRDYFRSVAKR
jgi:uncharacterized phage-associated protein